MLRLRTNRMRTFLSAMFVGLLAIPASAQNCVNGRCPQPRMSQPVWYMDAPVVREERFPEFRNLRDEYVPSRTWESVPSRTLRYRSGRDLDSRYFGHSIETPVRLWNSSRDREWDRYHNDWNTRYPDTRRERVRPAEPSRDFYYSGFGSDAIENRRRPTEWRFSVPREFDNGFGTTRDRFDRFDDVLPENDRYEYEPVRRSTPSMTEKLTARYSDPTSVRFAMSLSGNQGLVLFREVSQLIDSRHLSPKSYSERMRRGAASLKAALSNDVFRRAVRLEASTSRVRNFNSQLDQITSRGVRNRTEAEQLLRSVMQFGSQSLGLRPGLIAFEFTNASLDSLDRYSALEPSSNTVSGDIHEGGTKTAMSGLDEHVTGIGVEVKEHREGLVIVRTLRGGPSERAGLLAGDVIRQIDGRNIGGTNLASSVAMIGGSAGTQIRLLIARKSKGTKTFTLVRRTFRVYSVNDVKMADQRQGVGYLRLSKFARSSASEMDRAIQDLRSQGMKSLIVDVRGNPGGLLTTAVEISDKFLRCGRIVATRGRLASDNSVETASASGTWSMPLVVLADGDSASASEIFAAAIQENGRGIVIGERTYGKGTVQTHFPLASRLGTLRLTTARFYSPKNRQMAGNGVTPDVRTADSQDALNRAVTAARHPRLAEMVAEHGTCRPGSSMHQHGGSAATTSDALSASLP